MGYRDRDTRQKVKDWAATKGISADPYRGELLGIYTIMLAIKYIEFNTDMEMQGTTISDPTDIDCYI